MAAAGRGVPVGLVARPRAETARRPAQIQPSMSQPNSPTPAAPNTASRTSMRVR